MMSERNDSDSINNEIELNTSKGGGQYSHENDRGYLERQRKYAPAADIKSLRINKRDTKVPKVQDDDEMSVSDKLIAEKLRIISKTRAL